MQMGGTGSRGILRVTRTASNKASGVNADSSSRGCARRGMGFEVTAQVYRNLRTRLRDGGFGKSRHGRDLAPIGQGGRTFSRLSAGKREFAASSRIFVGVNFRLARNSFEKTRAPPAQ